MKYLILLFLFFPFFAGAVTESSLGASISSDIKPEYPRPDQEVTVTLNSYQLNLDQAQITWFFNTEKRGSGLGLKTFTVLTGPLGTPAVIRAVINVGGQTAEKLINLRPATVDLLWEAHTYTPPGYLGKALPSPESLVTIWADPQLPIANGGLRAASGLTFKWYRNGNLLSQSSGAGKDSLQTRLGNTFDRNQISVLVSANDGTVAVGELDFRVVSPRIVFYPVRDEGSVDYTRAVGSIITLTGLEPRLAAEPYYIANPLEEGTRVNFNWQVDNKPAGNGNIIRFNNTGAEELAVNLEVNNPESIFQKAVKSIKVILAPSHDIFPF